MGTAKGTTGVCIPAGEVTVNQQVRVVVAYIDARPNRLHEDFRILSGSAQRCLAVQGLGFDGALSQ
jgi:hypothetical protein